MPRTEMASCHASTCLLPRTAHDCCHAQHMSPALTAHVSCHAQHVSPVMSFYDNANEHLHSHPKHTILLFPHRNPTSIPPQHLNTRDRYQRTTQRGTTANDHNIFLWEVMHNVQQQLNNMMSVMSITPASWGKPTYTQ